MTVTSLEVAVARATVAASITFIFAVPTAFPVTGQLWRLSAALQVQATGVVKEPAINASAAVEA